MEILKGISKPIIKNSIQNNKISKKEDKKNNVPDINTKAHIEQENWQAISGISVDNHIEKANKLINKFALTGKLGIDDISNLKKIIKTGNAQAKNVSMLLSLVQDKTVNPKTLKYICKDGIMSDSMEKDIKMIFDAKNKGTNPDDAYIPHFNEKSEALSSAETGDLFELEGQKNIYIKNKNGEAEQLKMDKEMMLKLFPPAERFANAQTYSADCYFVSTINSMMDSKEARAYFLQCFEQNGNDLKITFPSNNYTYTVQDAKMPKVYKGNFVTGSTGMKLLEYAYGKFLEDNITKKAQNIQKQEIEKIHTQLEKADNPKDKKELEIKLKNYSSVLKKFNNDIANNQELVVELDSNREPVINDYDGISLRSLSQMNSYRKTTYQTAGDFYRGDGGYMEDVFKDFGYQETKAYSIEDNEIQEIMQNPELSKNYIFSGGTKREGKQNFLRAELIMDKSLNMYGAHAYRIIPSQNENGEIIFKVSNPWNSSHNSILTMEQMKQFFSEIHIAKIK